MKFIKPEDVVWKEVKYLKEPLKASPEHATWKYTLTLPEPLASWDVFDYWEKERIASMEQHLKRGDVLFDVGTEQGWCNLVYAQIVGPENMVLIEPTKEFWPNIRATWEKNELPMPKALLSALVSDKWTEGAHINFPHEWPEESNGPLIDKNKYQYIHDNTEGITEIPLDDWVVNAGVVPDAITMDTEGSELLILKGAENTLTEHRPKLFISIHDDLAERDYGVKPGEVIDYLTSLGYTAEYLATDHERHFYFEATP